MYSQINAIVILGKKPPLNNDVSRSAQRKDHVTRVIPNPHPLADPINPILDGRQTAAAILQRGTSVWPTGRTHELPARRDAIAVTEAAGSGRLTECTFYRRFS